MSPAHMRKHTLWAGPEDGSEVLIPPETFTYMILGPAKLTPGNIITATPGPNAEIWRGRYQFNSMTKRFEWMGWE